VLHSRVSRLAVAAVAASASIASVVGFVGTAHAAGLKIKCTALTGTITGNITLSGCNGNTGGSSLPMPATSLATGGTITWVNTQTTTVTLTSSTTETDPTEALKCPKKSTEYEAKGSVTADTTGSAPVGGKASGEACVDAAGNITLEPGSVLKLK
jgi:hypothetical protein